MRYKLFVILLITYCPYIFGQLELNKNYGINIGFVSALGTHVQRVGFVFQGYYVNGFAQVNAGVRVYNNFKDLGPKGYHTELTGALGVCFGFGKTKTEINPFISSVGNQTRFKNSISYSYNFWYNKIKTSQVTGTVAFQFNHISVITENDILAKPMLDRFRTGAMIIQYQNNNFQYAVNATMFTGQLGNIIKTDTLFPFAGYINNEGGLYQNVSHGLLSAQVKYADTFGQYLQANAGIDAEQIRNALQNKALHDIIPNNYHMPMLDTLGNQYLYKPGQKIKKATLFLNAFTNANNFY